MAEPRDLVIEAGPGAEISLADGELQTIRRGAGSLTFENAPADLYTVRIRVGDTIDERTIFLPETPAREQVMPAQGATLDTSAGTVRVRFDRKAFASVAPLAGTSRARDAQSTFASELSRRAPYANAGRGARLLVVSRAWEDGAGSGFDPAKGIEILSGAGKPICELSKTAERIADSAGYALEVDPGFYRVRLHRPDRPTVEQSLWASPGWQTQLFVLRQPSGDTDRLNLSVLMSRSAVGFDPQDDAMRLTELALQGLGSGRSPIRTEDIERMLNSKFGDPMLGIYAGHLLAAQPSTPANTELLAVVVRNLRGLLERPHPDVEALALAVPSITEPISIPEPPMLTASWRRIIEADAAGRGVIPAGSASEAISDRLWGSGVWLWWRRDRTRETLADDEGLESMSASRGPRPLRELLMRAPMTMQPTASMSRYERALLRMVPAEVPAFDQLVEVERGITRSMGLPRTRVEHLASELLDAMDAAPPPPAKAVDIDLLVDAEQRSGRSRRQRSGVKTAGRKAHARKAAAKKAGPKKAGARKAAKKGARKMAKRFAKKKR